LSAVRKPRRRLILPFERPEPVPVQGKWLTFTAPANPGPSRWRVTYHDAEQAPLVRPTDGQVSCECPDGAVWLIEQVPMPLRLAAL